MTGDLLSLKLASESSSNTKKFPPAIPVENEKSLYRHPKFASGIELRGKGSRELTFEMRLLFES